MMLQDIIEAMKRAHLGNGEILAGRGLSDLEVRQLARAAQHAIADRLKLEGDDCPCSEDAAVYHGASWLVRADFSYNEAERLETAAESH